MKMFKLILALSCVVIFCECNIVRRDGACAQLRECVQPTGLFDYFFSEGDNEQLCQVVATFKNCTNDLRPLCNNSFVNDEVDSALAGGEFMCSADGIQVISAAAYSDCITNTTKKSEMGIFIANCKTSAITSAFNTEAPSREVRYCRIYEHALTCATNYINENCGAIYGAFVREYYRRAVWPSFNCELEASHVRRFVDAVRVDPFNSDLLIQLVKGLL
ncbi:unnamed protein product [Lymnaea stagnalis]|uniref:Uncharacterized protein n=1 Tax=Lymnaea stagnalis TaxID=6523 RepID=A0AAV2I4U8_LYMST